MQNIIFRKRSAFSFIEITLALFFITCMASGAMFVSSHIKGLGDISAAKSRVSALGLKVREYYAIHDAFPATLESLSDEIPDTFIDPWGKSYSYKANDSFFVIVSGGPDKTVDTSLTDKFSRPSGDDIGICLKIE